VKNNNFLYSPDFIYCHPELDSGAAFYIDSEINLPAGKGRFRMTTRLLFGNDEIRTLPNLLLIY